MLVDLRFGEATGADEVVGDEMAEQMLVDGPGTGESGGLAGREVRHAVMLGAMTNRKAAELLQKPADVVGTARGEFWSWWLFRHELDRDHGAERSHLDTAAPADGESW